MSKRHIGRRSALQFAGSLSMVLFAAKIAGAKDRSVSGVEEFPSPQSGNSPDEKPSSENQKLVEYSCNNAGVPISDKSNRVSLLEDFNDSSSCEITPRSFEGPYFYCGETRGKNIAAGQIGEPLIFALRVIDAKTCTPLAGAIVDVWHANAKGFYAGYDADPDEEVTAREHLDPTNGNRWCRGALVVDEDGIAEFETVYPGYYFSRAVHIHYKVHLGNQAYVTNQTLMPETYNKSLLSRPPYNTDRNDVARKTERKPNSAEAALELDTLTIIERDSRLVGVSTVVI